MIVSPIGRERIHLAHLPLNWLGRSSGRTYATPLLWLIAFMVGGLLLIPPSYLLIRAIGAGPATLAILLKASTFTALVNTLLLAGSVTLASAALAVPMAWLTVCTDLPGRKGWTIVAALPLVLPSYVSAYLLVSTLGPRGLLQQFLAPLTGLERLPEIYGFPGAFLALTAMSYPYTFLAVRAVLRQIDPAWLEASRSLGLTPWQTFWRITLPQLRPGLIAGSLLVALYVLRDFGAVAMMRYDTFTRLIYTQYRSFADRSLTATLALLLIALTAVILYLESRTRGQAHYARRGNGVARRPHLIRLGRWKWLALLFMISIVAIALLLPAGGLLYWLVRGLIRQQSLSLTWLAAWNSFTISLSAALTTTLVGLPIAILVVRRPGSWSHILERLTYASQALPGIVIALALVFLGLAYTPSLYQSLPMLIAAYVILFIPHAVGSTRASLLQISPNLEWAARSLGATPGGVLGRVLLPLLRPGLTSATALVFLTCMKELPATLILSPIGFKTLATAIWSNISEAFFAQAALPALLLLLLSSIPLAILTLREQ